MWRFEEIKNYANTIFPEFYKKKFLKKLDYEGETREIVTRKKVTKLREGLVVIFLS